MEKGKELKKNRLFLDKDILDNALIIHSIRGSNKPRKFMLGSAYKLKKYLSDKYMKSVSDNQ